MAAAEGTVVLGPARLGPLFGLTSALLLRDRRPDLGGGPDEAALRWGGRAGDVSREDSGELAVDGEPDTFNERAPLSVWCRMGTGAGPLSAVAAGEGVGAAGLLAADSRADVGGVVVDAGSADSGTPVMERKEPSLESVMMADGGAWGPGAGVAC